MPVRAGVRASTRPLVRFRTQPEARPQRRTGPETVDNDPPQGRRGSDETNIQNAPRYEQPSPEDSTNHRRGTTHQSPETSRRDTTHRPQQNHDLATGPRRIVPAAHPPRTSHHPSQRLAPNRPTRLVRQPPTHPLARAVYNRPRPRNIQPALTVRPPGVAPGRLSSGQPCCHVERALPGAEHVGAETHRRAHTATCSAHRTYAKQRYRYAKHGGERWLLGVTETAWARRVLQTEPVL